MDTTQLAAETVKYLASVLPAFVLAGKEALQEIGKKVGGAVVEAGQKIWNWLKPHADANPVLADAAQKLANDPDNADRQATLRTQLNDFLAAQPHLMRELETIIGDVRIENRTAHAGGAGSVANVGNMEHVTITTNVTK